MCALHGEATTDGCGAGAILDILAGDDVPRELGALAEGGRLALIASVGGSHADIDGLIVRCQLATTVCPSAPGPSRSTAPSPGSRQGAPHDPSSVSPAEAVQARALMQSSAHIGKRMLQTQATLGAQRSTAESAKTAPIRRQSVSLTPV